MLSVLIIEDSPTNAKIIQKLLSEKKADQVKARVEATLDAGLEAVTEEKFDIILLDLELPDSSGVQTVNQMVAAAGEISAIIVMTSTQDDELALNSLAMGCQDYLIKKTMNSEMLWRVIRYSMERQSYESVVRDAKERFADFASVSSDWYWEMERNGRFIYLSHNFQDSTGIAPEEFLDQTLLEIGMRAEANVNWSAYVQCQRERRSFRDLEFAFATESGDPQWFSISGKPLFDKAGHFVGYRGTGKDITLDRYAEWELRRSKALVDGVLSTSLDGFLVLTKVPDKFGKVADFKFSHINRRAEEMLKRSRRDLLGKLLRREMPHMVAHGLLDHATTTVETGVSFDVEHFYDKGAMQGWYRIVGVRLEDSVVITLSDVSGRKEAEREQRLAKAVFDTTAEAMMITDHRNHIISVNAAFTAVTGYTKDDVVGRNPSILSSGQQPKEFYIKMWDALDHDGFWVGEVWNRHKNGEIYVQRLSISVVRNEQGGISNYVAVISDITESRLETEKLRYQANFDALTGLPNRVLIKDRLSVAMAACRRENSSLALMVVDLDSFKPVNDTYGHLVGDHILRVVAERLLTSVRETDTVARIGGDEFLILAQSVGTKEDAEKIANKVIDGVSAKIRLEKGETQVGASVGIAFFPKDAQEMDGLIKKADGAMYHAKKNGKGRFSCA